jgi:hypothetical protein
MPTRHCVHRMAEDGSLSDTFDRMVSKHPPRDSAFLVNAPLRASHFNVICNLATLQSQPIENE